MIKVSDAFNKAFASPTRQVLAKVTMNDVVYTNNDLSSVEYDGGSISGENFNIGSTFSNGIKLTFPKIIEGVKQLDKIKLEFGIVLPDGSSEYVSMGYFFVSAYDPQRNEKRTVIEAFDEMTQLEGSYSSKLTYPAKIQDVALEIANKAGVVINAASFERLSQNKITKIQGLTYRQAIGIIAQFAYGYAIFDRNGQLDIRMLKDPNFSIATADYFSRGLTKNETMYTLNGINCRVSTKGTESNEDYILQSGSDKGNQISLENNVMTQFYLDDIYQQLKTLNYYPFTLSWRGNPAIEAGDWLSMTDITGKVFKIPNLSYRLNFSGGLKATSSANTSSVAVTSSEYKGSLHQKVKALEGWRNSSGGWSYTQVQEPKNPQEGDVWYKPNGPDTELWVYEGGKWVLKTSTAKNRELEGKLDQAKEETDAALAEKDKAIKDLDKKVTDKITQTNTAVTQAQSDATAAKSQADAAVAKANSNTVTINAAKIDITKALNDSTSALNAIKLVDGRVDSVTTTIANVKSDVDNKADKTVVAGQISQSATKISQDLQSWTNGQLTNYSTIQSTATSIASAVSSKADKSQITQLSDQITSTVTSLTNETLVSTEMIKNAKQGFQNLPDFVVVEVPTDIGETYTLSSSFVNRGTVTAPITDVFYVRALTITPSSTNNGAYDGKNVTLPALNSISYIAFRSRTAANAFVNGNYWVQFSKAPASQSQITQLVNDINLRVIKGDVVNQINISPESILIAGNKIQITGETYIENGVIDDAKIKTLSASKLTAGTIDAAKINVLNINASNITTGILNADRIGANSITATHINVANLAAISANLGTITAGTINAATVRIINLDAGAISTGTLNANRIAAYSITADKIQATSLDLFNADFYTNVQADGMRMQGKAQIIFGKWKDSSGVVRNSEGIYIGGYNAGVKYVALTRADGSTFMLRANSDMDIGTNKNVAKESLNIYDTTHFWYPQINHSDLTLNGYLAMGGDLQEASIQYDKASATLAFRVPGGRSGSAFWFNQNVNAAGSFNSTSLLSLKDVKGGYQGNALEDILHTDIVEYSYKNNPKVRQLSPIIDDVNKIKQFTLPDIINDGKTVNLYAMSSLSWLAIQQLAEKLEHIEEKIDAIA